MTALPRISVIVTTYNRRRLLSRAIDSVLTQEVADFELIVVDDCSTDETNQYLATLTDPRIRVTRPSRNVGLSAARNLGIEAATADIVALLDDDDIYLQKRLSAPLAIFDRAPDVVATLSSAVRTTPKKTEIQRVPEVKLSPAAFEWALACMLLGPEGTSITFRRKAAIEIGGFNTGMLWYEGMDFLMRLTRHGAGFLIAEPLWQKFWSADAITSNWSSAGPNLLLYRAAQSEFFMRYRKLGSYLASKIIVADLRYRLVGALWRDLRDFRSAGIIDGNIARIWRDHVDVRRYRRKMLKPEALAKLTGPPDCWS